MRHIYKKGSYIKGDNKYIKANKYKEGEVYKVDNFYWGLEKNFVTKMWHPGLISFINKNMNIVLINQGSTQEDVFKHYVKISSFVCCKEKNKVIDTQVGYFKAVPIFIAENKRNVLRKRMFCVRDKDLDKIKKEFFEKYLLKNWIENQTKKVKEEKRKNLINEE